VNACADNYLTFSKVNLWLSGDRAELIDDREGDCFEALIKNLADDIDEGKTLFKEGNSASAWEGAARSIFLAVQLHDLLKIIRQEGRGAKEVKAEIQKNYASEHGKLGAKKHHEPMKKLKAWVIEKYRAGKKDSKEWDSKRQASIALVCEAMNYGKTINANLSPQNAQDTIYRWIRNAEE
jgi:hypothetical protein